MRRSPQTIINYHLKRLPDQKRIFIQHYLKTGNGNEALAAAGYQVGNPYHAIRRLKRDKHISRIIEMAFSRDRVFNELDELLAIAKQQERVGDGVSVLKLVADIAGYMTEAAQNPQNRPRDLNDHELIDAIKEEIRLRRADRRVLIEGNGKDEPDSLH